MYIGKLDKFMRPILVALLLSSSGVALADKLPEESFALARLAIEEAQEVDADPSISGELTLAERKFQAAVENNDDGRDEIASRLLKQSMLHAELAEVEALQAQADFSFTELNAALTSLEAEIRRD